MINVCHFFYHFEFIRTCLLITIITFKNLFLFPQFFSTLIFTKKSIHYKCDIFLLHSTIRSFLSERATIEKCLVSSTFSVYLSLFLFLVSKNERKKRVELLTVIVNKRPSRSLWLLMLLYLPYSIFFPFLTAFFPLTSVLRDISVIRFESSSSYGT